MRADKPVVQVPRLSSLMLVSILAAQAAAQEVEYQVQVLREPPPGEALAEDITALLAGDGVKVSRGQRRTVCEIWLAKQWPARADFTPTSEVQYPFQVGELVGVVRFRRKASDFREREIPAGVYTLRYAQQPVDGNHVGTSPTRDFLCLVGAEKDRTPGQLDGETLVKLSAEASESNHPALLCLQSAQPAKDGAPAIRHDKERDWWIVSLQGTIAGSKPSPLPLDVVIIGHAPE